MATLGDLKTRIITEVNRDDLQDDLADLLDTYIASAIVYYSNSRFWFNETTSTSVLNIGAQYQPLPGGLRVVDEVFIIIGNVRYRMNRREMDEIESLYSVPMTGQPTDYCIFDDNIRVWPTPSTAWQLIWLTITDVTPLTDDASSNFWTNEGADLIDARTRYLLYRDAFRDAEGATSAKLAEDEAYRNLKGQTNRRIGVGRIRASW